MSEIPNVAGDALDGINEWIWDMRIETSEKASEKKKKLAIIS